MTRRLHPVSLCLALLPIGFTACDVLNPAAFYGEHEGIYSTDAYLVDFNCDGGGLASPQAEEFFKLADEPAFGGLTYFPCVTDTECLTLDELLEGDSAFFWTSFEVSEQRWSRTNMATVFDDESRSCLAVWFTHELVEDGPEGSVTLTTLGQESYLPDVLNAGACTAAAEAYEGERSCISLDTIQGTLLSTD